MIKLLNFISISLNLIGCILIGFILIIWSETKSVDIGYLISGTLTIGIFIVSAFIKSYHKL